MSGRASLLVAMGLWGLSQVANRQLVLEVGPRELFLLRFSLGALTLLPIWRLVRAGPPIRRADMGRIAVAALLNSLLYQPLIAYGVVGVNAGTSALLLATEPVFIALLSVAFLRDRPSARLYAGLAISALGTVLLVGARQADGRPTQLLGALLVLGASLSFSVYSILVKPLTQRYPALKLTAWYTLIGAASLWPFAWLPDPIAWRLPDLAGWASALLLGAGCTVGSVVFWNYGLKRVPAATAGSYLYLISPFGVMGGIALLGERVTLMSVIAGLLIIGGVVLGSWSGTPAPRQAAAAGGR